MSRINKEDISQLSFVPIVDKLKSRTVRKRLSSRANKSSLARRKVTSTAAVETCVLRKTRKTGRNVRKTKKKIVQLPKNELPTPDIHTAIDSYSNPTTTLPLTSDTITNDAICVQAQTDVGDDIVMCAKTRQEKEKVQLARQKQLDNMRAREAAEAREERLLKRSGLWTSPVKEQAVKKISWHENIVTSIFNYQQV